MRKPNKRINDCCVETNKTKKDIRVEEIQPNRYKVSGDIVLYRGRDGKYRDCLPGVKDEIGHFTRASHMIHPETM